jgi:hypothetical protein
MSKIWWEKTVEYKFVCDYCEKTFLTPLDGQQEKAGDTIVSSSKKFILIEFKKSFNNIKDEQKKYPQKLSDILSEIKEELNLYPYAFHKLIYGEINDEEFILKETNYWDCIIQQEKGKLFKKNILIDDGIDFKNFKKYIEKLISLKSSSKTDISGSGSFNSIYGNVIGINSEGEINQIVSVEEFVKETLNIDISLQNKNTPKQSPKFKGF